jgi:transposase
MDTWMHVPRHVPDVRVLSTHRPEPGPWLIRVESTLEGTPCRRGGREIHDLHGLEAVVRLRHLPLVDGPVCIESRPNRSRCPCGVGTPPTTPWGAWDAPRRPHTNASAPWAWRLVITTTVADAARTLGIAEETSDGLLDRWLACAGHWAPGERLGGRGLEAIARTRGPRDCGTVVTGPVEEGGVELVAVRADRQQETGTACLRAMPARLRPTVERACPEMAAGCVHARTEAIPGAEGVMARVHGARASRDGADTGRKQARTRLKPAVPTAAYAAITGAMGPLRQRPEARTPEDGDRRARRCTSAPKSEGASHRREDRTDVCERDDTKAGATGAIRAWCRRVRQRGLTAFERVRGPRERWRDASPNDVQGRQTSGLVEGVNTRVKVLTRRCSGMFTVGRLGPRLTLALHGDPRLGHT